MNRRSFLGDILRIGVGSMILPSALSYTRRWKRIEDNGLYLPLTNPAWKDVTYEIVILGSVETWKKLLNRTTFPPNMGQTTRSLVFRSNAL